MASIQAIFPVYLPRSRTENQSTQDYDIAVSQNEANLNLNLDNLFNQVVGLSDTVEAQRSTIESQAILIQQLQEALENGSSS